MSSKADETLAAHTTPTGGAAPTTVADRYQILGLLGVGGMGSVYRARDTELDEVVALKILRRDLTGLPGMLDRFKREVKLARRVTHKNVARTFDIGEHEGDKYLTMELVEGESLSALLERHGVLPVAHIVELSGPICEGLAAAHRAGVVHRDLKPDNILIATDGRVVITDFGIARGFDGGSPTSTLGDPIGTPAYMAPEQVEGAAEVDARADLYALGIILYEMATGTRPFQTGSALAIAMARLSSEVPDPRSARADLPDGLVQVIRRCLARKAADRFASAGDVATALSAITRPGTDHLARVEPAVPSTSASGKSIAVLPFRNGGPPEDDYLADGLTDDLIDTLSMVRGLRVRSRGGVAKLKGVDRDPRQLGRELDVQVVVEGSLRRAANGQLRISTRMVSVADGFQLWARRFDRSAAEVLQVGDEAAQAIADALTVAAAPPRPGLNDPEALDLYLRARHEAHRYSHENVTRSIELFEQALARAPEDPIILAAYALARTRMSYFGGPEGRRSAELARDAASRAAAAAPDRAEPQVALGSILFQSGDAAGAVRQLRRALVAAPSLVDAHDILGRIYCEVGRLESAERHFNTSLALEPGMVAVMADLTRVYALMGDWPRVDRMLATPVNDRMRWQMALRLAMWRRDDTLVQATLSEPAAAALPWIQALKFMAEHHAMPAVEVHRIAGVDDSPDAGRRRLAFWWQLVAEGSAYSHQLGNTLDAVDRSIDSGLIDLSWLDACPLLVPLRGDARFVAQRARLVERIAPILAAADVPLL